MLATFMVDEVVGDEVVGVVDDVVIVESVLVEVMVDDVVIVKIVVPEIHLVVPVLDVLLDVVSLAIGRTSTHAGTHASVARG
ncbi:MAG: hypothetical protein ACTHXO_12790, partial [Actinomycetaceae bacterium]